jgi:hypothetical protein
VGQKKTQLMKRDAYALLKAAELAAEMVTDHERARAGISSIRVEAEGDPDWDDIQITKGQSLLKWQLKRLAAAVDFKLIEQVLRSGDADKTATRLVFGIASWVDISIPEKHGLPACSLLKLHDLCAGAQSPGVNEKLFLDTNRTHAAFKLVSKCLVSVDEHKVFALLRRLELQCTGSEEELRARAIKNLESVFSNASEVFAGLVAWFQQKPDGAIVTDCRVLYDEVLGPKATRHAGLARWMRLTRQPSGATWTSAGTAALEQVPSHAWLDAAGVRVIIDSGPLQNDAASAAIARLIVHRPNSIHAELLDLNGWRQTADHSCASTLGTTVGDAELFAKIHGPSDRASVSRSASAG